MYATLQQMLDRFDRIENPELTQLTSSPSGVRDDARIESALDEADGEINTYIGSRYPIPLTGISESTAANLARLACDIARYRLWSVQSSEEVRRRYEDAIGVLVRIAKGELNILLTTGTGTASGASARAAAVRMTRDNLGMVL
jgi:phage gp36-like protein